MKFLCYGYGQDVEHVARLARDGNEVRYFTPFYGSEIKFENYAPGLGFDKIEKIQYFFNSVDWADCITFFEVGAGDLTEFLRRTTKKPCFGAGNAEKLENHRAMLRQIQKDIGLPTQHTAVITGVDNLRKYLKSHPNQVVKLDIFRGDCESFIVDSYDKMETFIDEIEVAFGPFNEEYEFMVEDKLEGQEPGFDLYFNGTDYLRPYLWGYEVSESVYLGKYCDELPKPLQLVADKLKPVLQKYDYRGAISIEAIVTKEGKPYLIDITARYAYPLSLLYTESIANYSEVIYKVAKGESVTIKNTAPYVGALPMRAQHAQKHWVRMDFKGDMKYIKTREASKIKGVYYAVKGMPEVVVCVAAEKSPEAVMDKLKNTAQNNIEVYSLDKDVIGSFEFGTKMISESEKYGLGKF